MATDYKAVQSDLMAGAKKLNSASGDTYKAFTGLHHAGMADGALSTKIKELMAVAVSIKIGCEDCIGYHTAAAAKHGATREELIDTLNVSIVMGGGPASIYCAKALEAYDQFAG